MAKSQSNPRFHARGRSRGVGGAEEGFALSGRIWVEKEGETFLGWGRVVLLERIREHGSINAAARSMGMGYRHAWDLVDMMNRLSPKPLVRKVTGGRRGGGSTLTAEGTAALENFWALVDDFRAFLRGRDARIWRKRRKPRAKA